MNYKLNYFYLKKNFYFQLNNYFYYSEKVFNFLNLP